MPAHYGKKKIESLSKKMKPKPKGPDVKGPQPGGPGSVAKKPTKMVAKKPARKPMTRPKPVAGVIKPTPVKKRAK